MELSIIFVNWNSANYLRECIASIYEHTHGIAFEIIVVDNASPEGGVDALKEEFPDLVLIKSGENLGFAGANNLGFKHIPEEETSADKKAVELLQNSPYAQKLDNVGLFLKALQARSSQLNALLTTHLGNSLASGGTVTRLSALATQGPALDNNKLDQVAALPLGGRVKINPWDDKAEMVKTAPVAITSARDKMPFEVTPFFPRLARFGTGVAPASSPTTAAANTGN